MHQLKTSSVYANSAPCGGRLRSTSGSLSRRLQRSGRGLKEEDTCSRCKQAGQQGGRQVISCILRAGFMRQP